MVFENPWSAKKSRWYNEEKEKWGFKKNKPKSVLDKLSSSESQGGYYYSKDGQYLGEILGGQKRVRIISETYIEQKGGTEKTISNIKGIQNGLNSGFERSKVDLEYLNDKASNELYDNLNSLISQYDFSYCAGVIYHEAGSYEEMLFIAHTANNEANYKNISLKALLATGYSAVPKNKKTPITNKFNEDTRTVNARRAIIDVFSGGKDVSNGSQRWDGVDFIAWGMYHAPTVISKNNRHPKFNEFGTIKISKELFDELKNNSGTQASYATKKWENPKKPGSYLFDIPEEVFLNNINWSNNEFSFSTNVNSKTLLATFVKGKTIYWKIVK